MLTPEEVIGHSSFVIGHWSIVIGFWFVVSSFWFRLFDSCWLSNQKLETTNQKPNHE